MKQVVYTKYKLEDGMALPSGKGVKSVAMDCVKLYANTIGLLMSLTICERRLMDYLTEKMSDNNLVHSSLSTRASFNRYVYGTMRGYFMSEGKNVGEAEELAKNETYADVTVIRAFGTLVSKNLLIKRRRGEYTVNPEYFFKGTEFRRLKKIEILLTIEHSAKGVDIQTMGYE